MWKAGDLVVALRRFEEVATSVGNRPPIGRHNERSKPAALSRLEVVVTREGRGIATWWPSKRGQKGGCIKEIAGDGY